MIGLPRGRADEPDLPEAVAFFDVTASIAFAVMRSFPDAPSSRLRSSVKAQHYRVNQEVMPQSQTVRTTRGIQQSLLTPPPRLVIPREARGAVYTKRWVVELLLDLAGYRPEKNMVDAVAVESAAGDGAFLGPMIERLIDSCLALDRPVSACADSLAAYELDHDSATRARTLAAGTLCGRGIKGPLAERLANSWIRTGDYLLDATSIEADFVIGNPPYVRL